jgi:hypothetical protein
MVTAERADGKTASRSGAAARRVERPTTEGERDSQSTEPRVYWTRVPLRG